MSCEICGAPLDFAGQGHSCRRDRAVPSRLEETFALASRRVIRSAVTFAVLIVGVSALSFAGYTAIRGGIADPATVGTQASVLVLGLATGLVSLICLIVLLISTVVWIVSAHRLTPGGPGPLGYGALALSALLLTVSYTGFRPLSPLWVAVTVYASVRLTGIIMLIVSVLAAGNRIRRRTGHVAPAVKPRAVTNEDWDSSTWDPDVLRDIERRRRVHHEDPT